MSIMAKEKQTLLLKRKSSQQPRISNLAEWAPFVRGIGDWGRRVR